MVMMCFFVQVMSASAKSVTNIYNPLEIIFYRSLICLIALLGWMILQKKLCLLRTKNPKAQFLRAFFGVSSVGMAFWAYQLMPLPQALSLMLTSGLMITAASAFIMKEDVGPWQWVAVIVGLAGAVIASQPTSGDFNLLGTMAAIGTAATYTIVTILLRRLGRTEHSLTTVFYFMLFGVLTGGAAIIITGRPFHFDAPWRLLIIASAGLISQYLKTESLRLAEASILAPFDYTALIWGYVFGWILWKDIPNIAVWIGSLLIVAGNLLIIWQERTKKSRLAALANDGQPDAPSPPADFHDMDGIVQPHRQGR